MKRKNFTLPTLLLSQVLTPFTYAAPTSYDMNIVDYGVSMSLSGSAVTTDNHSYRIVLDLSKGTFIGERSDNCEQTTFEFLGRAAFYKEGEDGPSFIGQPFEDDGDVVFQLAESSENKKSYVGALCNSSVTGCMDMNNGEQFMLVHDTAKDLWYLSVRATIDDGKNTMMEFSDVELKKGDVTGE